MCDEEKRVLFQALSQILSNQDKIKKHLGLNRCDYEYGWEIVADNDGIYPDKMGCTACLEFGINIE